jgi:hypothetical protein
VDQLGGTARRPFGEVTLFEQQRAIAARRRVDGDAEPGRAAADDENVPGIALVVDASEGG